MFNEQYSLVVLILGLWFVSMMVVIIYHRRKKKKYVLEWPLPPSSIDFYEVASLSEVPDMLRVAGSLVYVTAGFDSRGAYIHDGTDFVKLKRHVCPTCGR